MVRDDGPKQGEGVGIVDTDGQDLTDLPRRAVENHDPVARGAACELEEVATALGLLPWCHLAGRDEFVTSRVTATVKARQRLAGLARPPSLALAGPLHQDLHLTADKWPVVLLADDVLDGQEIVVPPPLDRFRYVVRVQLEGLRPLARAVLEDVAV